MVEAWAVDGELPHGYAECAGKGICDRGTGTCACFDGYEGRGCERSSCPSGCSGHGKCRLIADLPGYSTARNTEHDVGSNTWTAYGWDEKAISACVCDGGYMGPDCSQRVCPFGDDPMTVCEQGDLQQVQRVRYSIRGDFSAGTALGSARLQNDQFAMRFKSYADEVFYTSAVNGIFGLGAHNEARVVDAITSSAGCTDGVGAFGALTAVTYSAAPSTSGTSALTAGSRGGDDLVLEAFCDGDYDGAGTGGIVYAQVQTAGSGYAVGDLVTIDPASGSDYAVLRVTGVTGGAVDSVEVVRAGSGYNDNLARYLVDDLSVPASYGGGLSMAAGTGRVEMTITAAGGAITAATVTNGASLTQWPEDRTVTVTTCASGRGNGDGVLAITDTDGTPTAAVTTGGTGYVTGDTCYGFPTGGGFSAVVLTLSLGNLVAYGAADYAIITPGAGYVSGDYVLFRTSSTAGSNDGWLKATGVSASGGINNWGAHGATSANTPTNINSDAALGTTNAKGGQGASITITHSTGTATVSAGGYGYMSTDTGLATSTGTEGTWIAGDDLCDFDGTTAATASGTYAANNLELALEAVPNFRVRSVTATFNAADGMQVQTVGSDKYLRNHLYVTFNHVDEGNSYGAQNLLMCPHSRMVARADGDNRLPTMSTYGCGAAGCQPRVQQPRAVTSSARSNVNGWGVTDASATATVDFTTDSVLTCVKGGLDGTESATCAATDSTHQGVVRVLLASDSGTWYVWAAASGAAAPAVGPTVPAWNFATARRYAEVADMDSSKSWGNYIYFGQVNDLSADPANANNKKLDISSLMADTFVSISTTNLAASSNVAEEYELAFTTAECEATVDVTTSATVSSEFGFENYDVENIECAGRGECDRATGTCTCFEGYHGLNCGEQTILI